jgi:hypothetical protein
MTLSHSDVSTTTSRIPLSPSLFFIFYSLFFILWSLAGWTVGRSCQFVSHSTFITNSVSITREFVILIQVVRIRFLLRRSIGIYIVHIVTPHPSRSIKHHAAVRRAEGRRERRVPLRSSSLMHRCVCEELGRKEYKRWSYLYHIYYICLLHNFFIWPWSNQSDRVVSPIYVQLY